MINIDVMMGVVLVLGALCAAVVFVVWFFGAPEKRKTSSPGGPLTRWCRVGKYTYADTVRGRWKSDSLICWHDVTTGQRLPYDPYDDLEKYLEDFFEHADPALLTSLKVFPKDMGLDGREATKEETE